MVTISGGGQGATLDSNGSLSLKVNGQSGTGAGGLQGSLYAQTLSLSTSSPNVEGPDNVYGFVYTGARALWLEAPAAGTINGGGEVFIRPGGDNLTAGGLQNTILVSQPGATGIGNRSGQMTFWDSAGTMRQSVGYGTGAPTIGGELGDLYHRCDNPGTVPIEYICTTAGVAGAAVWVAQPMVGSWQNAAMLNSWTTPVNLYGVAKYRLEGAADIVRLSGSMTGGAANSIGFVLPAGYRPSVDRAVAVANFTAVGSNEFLLIDTGGNVFMQGTTTTDVFLDGVTFAL